MERRRANQGVWVGVLLLAAVGCSGGGSHGNSGQAGAGFTNTVQGAGGGGGSGSGGSKSSTASGSGGAGGSNSGMTGSGGSGGTQGSAGTGGMAGSGGAGGMTGSGGTGGTGGSGGTGGTGGSGGTGGTDAGNDPCASVANPCTTAGKRCDANTLVTCAANGNGCLVETRADCTGSTPLCDSAASPPACAPDPCAGLSNACSTAGATCSGVHLVTCAQNQDGCLVQTTTDCTQQPNDNTCSSASGPAACVFDKCKNAQGNMKAEVCVTDATTCSDDVLVQCVADADGCPIAHRIDCQTDPGHNFCDDTKNPPVCAYDPCLGVTTCLQRGATCQGTKLIACEPDSNGCLVQTTTDCTHGGTAMQRCEVADCSQCQDDAGCAGCSPGASTPQCVPCQPDTGCSGKSSGFTGCNGNVSFTCRDTDGDGCLNRVDEDCGSTFTCGQSGCAYSGGGTCKSAVRQVLAPGASYGSFNTSGAGSDYSNYTCPGLVYTFQGQAPDLLFAIDVQPGQVVTVRMVNVSGFGSAGAWMLLLPNCANGSSSAESGCTAFSQSALTYGNSGTTPVRVYLTVDADGTTTGTFSFEVDSHSLVCGNGLREGSEQCDDSNIFSGDGCTPDCKLETGYECTSSNPSVCTLRPTNGICGNVQCPALPPNAPSGTELCCTTQAKCGIAYAQIYGASCFERDQVGSTSNMCPNLNAYPAFVLNWPALTGCCRSDHKCGLTAAVGAGCVERTAVYTAMQDGYGSTYYYQTSPVTAVSCTP